MKAKKICVTVALVSLLGITALTGCSSTSTGTVKKNDNTTYSVLYEYQNIPEEKTFEPGEHTFSVLAKKTSDSDSSLSYLVVDGYQVISTSVASRGDVGIFYEYVTYQNTKTVTVKPVYDEDTKTYNYSQFGTVIELENTESKGLSK